MKEKIGILSIVATPIGNLEDITLRAIRSLREADYVLCEDTRVTGVLLKHYGIETKLKRYDAHASENTHLDIINDIKNGKRVALVSDAGTPGISDPGVKLVQLLRAQPHFSGGKVGLGSRINAVPGPSAVTAAFSIAGLTGNQFTFLGYAPQKKGRQTFFAGLTTWPHPILFFESTHRIIKTLEALAIVMPERHLQLARELTKLHEEVISGTAAELLSLLKSEPVKQKGEFVVIVPS